MSNHRVEIEKGRETEKLTYVGLVGVACPDGLAVVPELVEQEEATEAVLSDEMRQADEGEGSEAAKRHLDNTVEGQVVRLP